MFFGVRDNSENTLSCSSDPAKTITRFPGDRETVTETVSPGPVRINGSNGNVGLQNTPLPKLPSSEIWSGDNVSSICRDIIVPDAGLQTSTVHATRTKIPYCVISLIAFPYSECFSAANKKTQHNSSFQGRPYCALVSSFKPSML